MSKRGGGLLVFGPTDKAREKLGAISCFGVRGKLCEGQPSFISWDGSVFTPEDEIEKLRLFLPGETCPVGLSQSSTVLPVKQHGFDRRRICPSSSAYGAGKCAYWGTEHDWRWAMETDEGTAAHRKFWFGLSSWLGQGGEGTYSS